MSETLTPAGWPRPVLGGYPIPWVSAPDDLATMDVDRTNLVADGARCAVCGEPRAADEPGYALVLHYGPLPLDLPAGAVQAMDNAVMHRRCLLLSLRHCPRLLALRAAGTLRAVRVRPGALAKVTHEDGILGEGTFTWLQGADCEPVALGDL